MYRTSNPIADAERYMSDLEENLKRFPKCSHCERHIQDEYAYYINSEWICETCMDENYRKEVFPEW